MANRSSSTNIKAMLLLVPRLVCQFTVSSPHTTARET